MPKPEGAKSHRAAAVSPAAKPSAPWRVAWAEARAGQRLAVRFVDGTSGEVELGPFLGSPAVDGTVFEALREPASFAAVQVVLGAVQWPNGADLAPDAMYDAIRASGRWVLPAP
jgi:Protein of unknown function (DUF2442)